MSWWNKKENGINWQKEVLETSKAVPAILKELENMGKGFLDHVEAGRKQRTEDKLWQSKLLTNSLECAKGKQVDAIQANVNTLMSDKKLKEGKLLGVKSVYVIITGGLLLIGSVLGIVWRLGLL